VTIIPNATADKNTAAETTNAIGDTPSHFVSRRGCVRISECSDEVVPALSSGRTLASKSSIVAPAASLRELAVNARQTASVLTHPTTLVAGGEACSAAFSKGGRIGGRPAVYNSKTLRDKDRRTQRWSVYRKRSACVLESPLFELFMGIIILFNIGVLVMQTNESMVCDADGSCENLLGYVYVNALLLALYAGELFLRMYTYRAMFFTTFWNNLDLIIVLTGFVDLVVDVLHTSQDSRGLVGLLRFFRVTRLFRAFRLLAFIPELYRLIQLLSGAIRALFWGLLLIVFMILFWSVVTVEFVQPFWSEIDFGDADGCKENFKSIWHTGLFFFQTLVVVDDWATCIKPLILEKPWTILFFGLAVISVQLFLVNLILSAIVDSAAAARELDHEHRAMENGQKALARMEKWKTIYDSMDVHMEGYVSREELARSFDEEGEVREFLQGLDITKQDLGDIFDLMDEDGSGLLPYNDFVNAFLKAQSQDARIYMMSVKMQTNHLLRAVQEQAKQIQDIRTTVRSSAERIAKESCGFHQEERHEDGGSSACYSSRSARSIVSVPPHAEMATPRVATPRVSTPRVSTPRVATPRVSTPRRRIDSESQLQQTNGEQHPVSQCTGSILDLGTDVASPVANETPREHSMNRELYHGSRLPGNIESSNLEAACSNVSAAELVQCLSAQLSEMQQQLIMELKVSVNSALLEVSGSRSSAYPLESAAHVLSTTDAAARSYSPKEPPRLSDDEIHGASTCRSTADSSVKRDESARREGTLASLKVVRSCYV